MIGRLRGILLEKQPPQLLLDIQGIGYEVLAPMSTFYLLPELYQEVILHAHLIVREDAHMLYGFHSQKERALFRALIRVNGVGPKLALTILSGIDPELFVRCVQEGDSKSLVGIPGIGKKTAERLVVEMKDRLQQLPHSAKQQQNQPLNLVREQDEAIKALESLGYKQQEAAKAISKIVDDGSKTCEQLIRQALQILAK